MLKGVSADDSEEDVAGVRSFHILSVLRFLVNGEYSVTTEQSVDECYRYTTAKTTPGVAHANTSSPHSAATPRSALRSMAAHRLLVLIQATTVSSTRMSSISLFLSSTSPLGSHPKFLGHTDVLQQRPLRPDRLRRLRLPHPHLPRHRQPVRYAKGQFQ